MEKLFFHVCCGPCACYPLEWFKENRPETELQLWFYNPNIHSKSEFMRRRDGLAFFAQLTDLKVDFSAPYEPEKFFAITAENAQAPQRCRQCYALRFEAAAQEAAKRGCKAFSSTLSFSKRQKHDLIVEEGLKAAHKHGVEFYYEDWRPGWQRGHEIAKSLGLYRQNYCGCIYSETER